LGPKLLSKDQKSKYWGIDHVYDDFPKITGFPNLIFERHRPYTISTMNGPITKIKKAPKKCYIGKLINYNYARFGAPMIKIVGDKGEGKSNLLQWLMALQAAKGIRMLTFNDRRMEVRSLASHGWFDENNNFHPFEIDIFRPRKFEYRSALNPLWEYYPNVHDREFETSDDIIQSMEPHKITVVYEEAFTKEGTLQLWNDLVEQLAEEVDSKKIFTFAHHEFARLIPENPSQEVNKLVKRASDNFSNFRKDKIGLDVDLHSSSYSFYQVIQRIGTLIQKHPVDKNRYNRIEKEALSYSIQDFAVKRGTRGWMKHTIGMYPELPDEFRLIPPRIKMLYPDLIYEDELNSNVPYKEVEDILLDGMNDRNKQMIMLNALGYTQAQIGDWYNLKEDSVRKAIYREKKRLSTN